MTWSRTASAAGVFIAILAVAYVAVFSRQLDQLALTRLKYDRALTHYVRNQRAAKNIDIYREQDRAMTSLVTRAASILPDHFGSAFEWLAGTARMNELRFASIGPVSSERNREFYAGRFVRLEVAGPFKRIAAFVADIEKLPGCARLERFVIVRGPRDGLVTLRGTIWAYRYVSDAELARDRRAAAESKVGAK